MAAKEKKLKLFTQPQIVRIQWYPLNKNPAAGINKNPSATTPPLMVRKADWRR
jgi:hypothetical protein